MAKLYVGNLKFSTTLDELKLFFAGFQISNAKIVLDKETQKPKGFGFVDVGDENGGAVAAVVALNGKELNGRTIRVNQAIDKPKVNPRTQKSFTPPPQVQPEATDDFGWQQPSLAHARRR